MKRLRVTFAALAVAGLAACSPGTTVPGQPVETIHPIGYYPACGTEILFVSGVKYYPFSPEDAVEVDSPLTFGLQSEALAAAALPRFAPPGPGDDVGTLVIYDNGTAFYRSSSGRLEQWLTTTPQEYNWVC